jgi:glutamine synthetase
MPRWIIEPLFEALEKVSKAHGAKTKLDHATHLCKEVIPAMAAVRKAADSLEEMVADDLWPLATYQEMLFIM